MKNNYLGRLLGAGTTGLLGVLALAGSAQAAALTPGNLVVVRFGDGAAVLTSNSTPTFLDEYTTAGVFVQTIALPIAVSGANQPLTNSGTATSEGFVTVSTSGNYLVLGGYGQIPGMTSIASSSNPTTARVIGRVDMAGNVDTTTALTDAFSTKNIRGVASDGTSFWATGSGTGIHYAASLGATTSVQLAISPDNTRVPQIVAGQLYISAAAGGLDGIASVGTGLPTTTGTVTAILPGFPITAGPSSYDFFFADPNRIYVADDRTTLLAGGIQRWDLMAGTWTLTYTLNPTATTGCRGLTGTVDGLGVATLYATTTTVSGLNNLVTVTDTGAGSLFTVLATCPTNTAFRGVRLLPANPSTPSTAYCSGDGTDTACPCTNPGLPGRGCDNTSSTGGASLSTSGIASISADTLVVSSANAIPFGPGLYYEGSLTANPTAPFGVPFGNGLRCAGGATNRLEIRFADGAGASNTTVSLAAFGAAVAGNSYNYQLWYRDTGNVGSCSPGAGFNFSNARTLTWAP